MAETLPIKSQILKQSSECINGPQYKVCEELVTKIEKLQLVAFEQNKFKCQSSLLGLQSELIEAHFLRNFSDKKNLFMIPYVIKNC